MAHRSMRHSFLVTAALAVLATAGAMVGGAGSAFAAVPTPVTIEATLIFANGYGTFTTSSGAGLCPSGTTMDQTRATGWQSGRLNNFHVLKTFTCDDGSGSFTALVQAHYVFGSPTDSFTWNIVSGTGDYLNLHGAGSGVGDQFPGQVDDHFVGHVHFE